MRFARSGVLVRSGTTRVGLSLLAVGYDSALAPVGQVAPTAHANRVLYRHSGLSEWYVNGPLGLEQGFTIPRAPGERQVGPLTLSMALSGNVRASLAKSGHSITFARGGKTLLRYGGLVATDARGRTLHGWLQIRAGLLLLRVDTRGARFPLRIDPLIQQGPKLVGTEGSGGFVGFGYSMALSSDGNTAVVGSPFDNEGAGAVWFFTRTGSTWNQQGKKLTGRPAFGYSVALSPDGNTALIGAPSRVKGQAGAAWVLTRTGSSWTQPGEELTAGGQNFGENAALSADGNTALISGAPEKSNVPVAWVFTRSGSTWTQSGVGLTCECAYSASLGVALSSDGNTALIGGQNGTAWVFTRSGSTWAQPGEELTGTPGGSFGYSVALSSDGNTALVGAPGEPPCTPGCGAGAGAAWVFTRTGSSWAQPGFKLTGGGETGPQPVQFGYSVALSGDGNTALVGGPGDNEFVGAAWVFVRVGSSASWAQQGSKLTGNDETGAGAFGEHVALSLDGETALIGGVSDSKSRGAAWVFASGTGGSPLTFTWRIVDRWGSYSGPAGATVPLYPVPAAPATFDVQVSACDQAVTGTYLWSSSAGGTQSGSSCVATLALPPGPQQLTLTLTPADGSAVQTAVQLINVNNLLIVSMGDSVASGEGNPDFPGQCDKQSVSDLTGTFTTCAISPIWVPQPPSFPDASPLDPLGDQNLQCHRSTHAAASLFADELQRSAGRGDGHYSVSFVDAACSGASVSNGLLGSWHGNQATPSFSADDQPRLEPQIEQVRSEIGTQIPDAVFLSIGGNDINFAGMLEQCLSLGAPCENPQNQAALTSAAQSAELKLAHGLEEVANCLSDTGQPCVIEGQQRPSLKIPSDRIWISEYFDPTHDHNGGPCELELSPLLAPLAGFLSKSVFTWAGGIVDELNHTIEDAASTNGWNRVPSAEFLDHGICAEEDNVKLNWVNTWDEDFTNQGDKYGFFHPNNEGQNAYEREMETLVKPVLDLFPPTGTVPSAPNQVQATTGVRSASVSWLPPDALPDTVQSYTVTSHPGGFVASAGSANTSTTVTGLTPGVNYSFTVTATNAAGVGPPSAASNAVVPFSVAASDGYGDTGPFPDPSSPATVTTPDGSLSATAIGTEGLLEIAQFPSDPVGGLRNGQSFFDVRVAPGSIFTSLTFTDCGVVSGEVLQWWDPLFSPPGWQDIPSDRISSGPDGCLTVAVPSAGAPPTLADLTGTVFGLARTGAALTISSVGDITTTATSPAGSPVSFTAPTGTDGGTVVKAVCNHASGETFPVGTTTVWCGVADKNDSPEAATTSFLIDVTPEQSTFATSPTQIASGLTTLLPPATVSTANSSFNAVGKPTVNHQSGAITFTEMVSNQGTFNWALSFKNGTFGVFSAAKKTNCKNGQIKLKGKCRPSTIAFGTGSKIVVVAGIVSFMVKPSASASKALEKEQGLSVTAVLSYQSARGGGPVSHVVSVTDKLTRKQKGKK